MTERIKFHPKKDYAKLGGLLALSYGGFASSLYLTQQAVSISDYAAYFGIISAAFLSMRLPCAQRIPLTIARSFAKAAIARKTSAAPQDLLDDAEELRRKAGLPESVKVRIVEKGATGRAYAFGGEIFMGKALLRLLKRPERKWVIAHEMAHLRTNDASERYLTWPPLGHSLLVAAYSAYALAGAAATGNQRTILPAMGTALLSCAYAALQGAIFYGFSRAVEYRADSNAVKLTGEFVHAATGLLKLSPDYLKEVHWSGQLFKTHPQGIDRLRNIERCGTHGETTPCTDLAYKFASEEAARDGEEYPFPEAIFGAAYDTLQRKRASQIRPQP